MGVLGRLKVKLKERKGASMVLMVCLFLVLCVLGINLLNAANANVTNTSLEVSKEQTMLYVSSVYEIINGMIESGEFSDPATGKLVDAETLPGSAFLDGNGREISVKITFLQGTMPVEAQVAVTCTDERGRTETYTVVTTYSKKTNPGEYQRESCKGLVDDAD